MHDEHPHGDPLGRKDYLEQMDRLQHEIDDVARWLEYTGKRLVVLFEGRDAAGKGGAIAAIAGKLNPRTCHVVALPTAGERERTQWYFQRYVAYLPAAGEITLFDRSWYNRAGVERVMGFCTEKEAEAFLQQARTFERMLVDDGILLLKYWLTVDQVEQEKRFEERRDDPRKRWKLSPIDVASRAKYAQYGIARDEMLDATDTKFAPWTLVDFGNQRRGRLMLIRHMLDRIPDRKVPDCAIELPPLGHAPLVEHVRDRRRRDVAES